MIHSAKKIHLRVVVVFSKIYQFIATLFSRIHSRGVEVCNKIPQRLVDKKWMVQLLMLKVKN
jgi:hypothetical protein